MLMNTLQADKHTSLAFALTPRTLRRGIPHADGLQPYNHQPNEVNVWVPLTAVFGSNSLTSESSPGAGDFHAFQVSPPPAGRRTV